MVHSFCGMHITTAICAFVAYIYSIFGYNFLARRVVLGYVSSNWDYVAGLVNWLKKEQNLKMLKKSTNMYFYEKKKILFCVVLS